MKINCQIRCKSGNSCINYALKVFNDKQVCNMHFKMLERNKDKNDIITKTIKIQKYSERILFLENQLLLEKYKNNELTIQNKKLEQQLVNLDNEFSEHKERMVKNLLDLSLSV